jgi:predicted lipoprotein with Yx(FWY)xxD motif
MLVNGQGHALYIFTSDNRNNITCVGRCAELWPPLKIEPGTTATASAGAKQSLLGTLPDPEGGLVVTYNGWPLYTYKGDSSGGEATGQGQRLGSGIWYVITASGDVIHESA